MQLHDIVNLTEFPLTDTTFQASCRDEINENGVLVLKDFMKPEAVNKVREEGIAHQEKAYFCKQEHNVYLTTSDPDYSETHIRNRQVVSSKGCITDDQIPDGSPLHVLYDAPDFRNFLCQTLGEKGLYDYADQLSSINLHYAQEGQELGWHFDNSSFATTLMVQEPDMGGEFEYVKNVRDADKDEMNFDMVEDVLDGKIAAKQLKMPPGALVLFRGRNAIHRVAPVTGNRTRMLVVLAYNSAPGIALSESARMTFYGRLS